MQHPTDSASGDGLPRLERRGRTQAKSSWSEFVVPLFVTALVVCVVAPQITAHYATSTITYGVLIGAPLVLLALIPLAHAIRGAVARERWLRIDELASPERVKLLVFCVVTGAMIFFFDDVGYPIAFFLYVLFIGRLLYRKSWLLLLALALGAVLIIHFVFVGVFDLALPAGFAASLIGSQ